MHRSIRGSSGHSVIAVRAVVEKESMKIDRRIIIVVGLGMSLIMAISIFALHDVTSAFSLTTRGVGGVFAGFQRIWAIQKNVADMSLAVHHFRETGNNQYRNSYEEARLRVRERLNDSGGPEPSVEEKKIRASLAADFHDVERKSEQIFSLTAAAAKGTSGDTLGREIDSVIVGMEKDIERYQDEHVIQMGKIVVQLQDNKEKADLLFVLILIGSVTFLLLFGIFLHRKVAAPLVELWKGAEEISRGNLDHRIEVQGATDIALLGEQFNEMAQKVKQAYTELEQKLLDRTRELAALDAVALTLAQAGNLKDMLGKSLAQIFDSLTSLELRGGVFLCDAAGQKLHLIVHQGLSPEFVQREESIQMGECLCGRVAQTGELLYEASSCEDPLHSRSKDEEPHGHIIIPIKSRGIVLGVIFLYPKHDFTLKPSDIQMLDAIGVQLGMGVENLRFYAEVKESSEKFWDLFENSRDILFTTDAGGNVTAANKETENFLGYSKVELFGKSVLDFLAQEDVERAKDMLAGRVKSEPPWTEFEVVKRDGSRASIEVSARRITKDGQPAGFQVSARDMTERKNLRELLVKAERLGAIGQVGVAVRHEINNPLTTVIGNIELLIERYDDKDKELRARLETILNNALRIGEIVKRLQGIKQEKVVDYLKGVKMTDLKPEAGRTTDEG